MTEDFATAVAATGRAVYRRIDGVWRVVHRHADPLTAKTSVDAVLAEARG